MHNFLPLFVSQIVSERKSARVLVKKKKEAELVTAAAATAAGRAIKQPRRRLRDQYGSTQ